MLEDVEMLAAVRAESNNENEAGGAECKTNKGQEDGLQDNCTEEEAGSQFEGQEVGGACNDLPAETRSDTDTNNVPNTNAGKINHIFLPSLLFYYIPSYHPGTFFLCFVSPLWTRYILSYLICGQPHTKRFLMCPESLSHQKKDGRVWYYFWYYTDFLKKKSKSAYL